MKGKKRSFSHRVLAPMALSVSLALGLMTSGEAATPQPPASQDDSSSLTEKIVDLDLLTPFSIIASTVGGIVAYRNGEAWRRRQYIEEKIKSFESSPEAINIRKMISAELHCIELFPFVEKAMERFAIVEDCLWTEALLECKCNEELKEQYRRIDRMKPLYEQDSAVKSCIRDNFNMFMLHLQHFEKMIEAKSLDQEKLRGYLYPWFEAFRKTESSTSSPCPISKQMYSPQTALLEYMGLLVGVPEENLSVAQRDVRALVTRYRGLDSFLQPESSDNQPSDLPASRATAATA